MPWVTRTPPAKQSIVILSAPKDGLLRGVASSGAHSRDLVGLAMTMRITSAYATALASQSSKRVGMIRAPSSGTSVRNASGAPKYGTSAPATIRLLSPCLRKPAADEKSASGAAFGTCDLARMPLAGLAQGHVGERCGDVVGKHWLHQLAGDMNRAIPAPGIRDPPTNSKNWVARRIV